MRLLTILLMVFCFCFLSTRNALVFSYFKWNQEYIIANFCENKAVKEYTCQGNCRLSKMMKATEEQDRPASAPIIPNLQLEEFFSVVEKSDMLIPKQLFAFVSLNDYYTPLVGRLLATAIFHPPK